MMLIVYPLEKTSTYKRANDRRMFKNPRKRRFKSSSIRQKKRHHANRHEADFHLEALAKIQTPQEQFYYLRGIDEYVFEEMVLTALAS
jgi:hypothetical protein